MKAFGEFLIANKLTKSEDKHLGLHERNLLFEEMLRNAAYLGETVCTLVDLCCNWKRTHKHCL